MIDFLPNMAARVAGIRSQTASPSQLQARRRGMQSSSPFTAILPTFEIEPAAFDVIPVPDGFAASTVAGQSAWFLFKRVRIDADQQECTLVGAHGVLLPADVDGGGGFGVAAGDAIGWGAANGTRAAIVVARNLPIEERIWTHRPTSLAGIEDNAAGTVTHARLNPFPIIATFPTGKFSDTVPNKIEPRWTFVPYQFRFSLGDTIDVALVVNNSQIVNASGATDFIVGFADLRLTVGLIKDTRVFAEQTGEVYE